MELRIIRLLSADSSH